MKIFEENRQGEIREVDTDDLNLPKYVLDTLSLNCMAIHNDLLYATTMEALGESKQPRSN
jgi:hypothetical protein